jgi:hypothetical protein
MNGCTGVDWKEIDDVVVVTVERDVERSQRKLVGDMVVGRTTADSLNIRNMAGTVNARTLSPKSLSPGS